MERTPVSTTMEEATSTAAPARSKLRQRLELSWVISIVVFTLARFFVAQETLERYGLNIWVFGFIDLVTAVPYALGTARVVGAMVDRDLSAASRWAGVAAFCFIAPYAYIVWSGKDATFPTAVYVVLAILVAIFGANAVWSIARKVKAARVAASAGREGGSEALAEATI